MKIDSYFGEPFVSIWLLTIGFFYFILNFVHASIRQTIGRGFSWKERQYDQGSGKK